MGKFRLDYLMIDDENPECEQLMDLVWVGAFKDTSPENVASLEFLSNQPKFCEQRIWQTYDKFQKWITEKAKRGYTLVSVDADRSNYSGTMYFIFWNKDH